jgi:hypothetical protein
MTTVTDVAYSVPIFTPDSRMRVTLSCGHTRTYVIADYVGPSPKFGEVMPCADCQPSQPPDIGPDAPGGVAV